LILAKRPRKVSFKQWTNSKFITKFCLLVILLT